MGRIRPWELLQLSGDFYLYLNCQGLRCGNEEASCVWGMLRLCEKICRDPWWVPPCSEDDRLGGTCREIDCTITADELLRCGDVAITRTEDFFHSRDALRSVSERANRLSAANPGNFRNSQEFRSREQLRIGTRADDYGSWHACHRRGYRGHHEGRYQGVATAGDVATDGIDGPHNLPDGHTRLNFQRPRPGQLSLCYP